MGFIEATVDRGSTKKALLQPQLRLIRCAQSGFQHAPSRTALLLRAWHGLAAEGVRNDLMSDYSLQLHWSLSPPGQPC